jgi:hypothetical protein
MKYLVCYPKGGIADILYVTEKCLEYCIKYNRMLIIYNVDSWIEGELTKYISFEHPNIYQGNIIEKLRDLEKLSIYPNKVKNLENLKSTYIHSPEPGYYISIDHTTNVYGNINLTLDYQEDVVVYCNNRTTGLGGWLDKIHLNHIKINKIVLELYNERILKLPKEYISLHIRNTDRLTNNLDDFLNNINTKIMNNCVFLASDNKKTIDYIKNIYGTKIHSFANITDNNGKNMHYYYNKGLITNEELVIDCLVDLLMLSSGKEIYYSCPQSNYSLLAEYLCNNKTILEKMLY